MSKKRKKNAQKCGFLTWDARGRDSPPHTFFALPREVRRAREHAPTSLFVTCERAWSIGSTRDSRRLFFFFFREVASAATEEGAHIRAKLIDWRLELAGWCYTCEPVLRGLGPGSTSQSGAYLSFPRPLHSISAPCRSLSACPTSSSIPPFSAEASRA